jgi:hypothetical protein
MSDQTSSPIVTETKPTSSPSSVETPAPPQVAFAELPLCALLGLPLHQMTADQKREYAAQLRACRTNPPTLAKALKDTSKPKKAKASSKPKIDVGAISDEYGV